MPGDLVDARLNNYFLERIFQYLNNRSFSFFDPGFFYPYPFVAGFSDNLFGASPIYLCARYLSFSPEAAFQFWFISSYITNYISAYLALKIFGLSNDGSAIGAALFTFGLPATAQMGHAQLQYRFGVPLAIVFFNKFLKLYDWRALIYSSIWLYWQFLCSIYLGFFTAIFMISMVVFQILISSYKIKSQNSHINLEKLLTTVFKTAKLYKKTFDYTYVLFFLALFLAFFWLFYPYYLVNTYYHFTRSWVEISAMLPRITSYFLADHSQIWELFSKTLANVPVLWEHQLFIGIVPIIIISTKILLDKESLKFKSVFFLLALSTLSLIILTLNFYDFSLWRLVASLPLFSSIRAVTRIILIILFPISIFLAKSVDDLLRNSSLSRKFIIALISIPLIIEMSAINVSTSFKHDWITREKEQEKRLPNTLTDKSIIFFSQQSAIFEQEELDSMIIAQRHNIATLNGYSGNLPHHFRAYYSDDCAEYPRRLILYLDFMGQTQHIEEYRKLAERLTPIGFVGCQESWKLYPPMSITHKALTKEEIAQLTLEVSPETSTKLPGYARLTIVNHGHQKISAISAVDRPLRLAWRVIGSNGVPLGDWTQPRAELPAVVFPQAYRRDLPEDIPPGGHVDILAPLPHRTLNNAKKLEFSIVQEATLWGYSLEDPMNIWAHEAGMKTVYVDLPID